MPLLRVPSLRMKSAWKAHMALMGANLIYGANYSLAKEVMPVYAAPSGIIILRVAGSVLLFGAFWALRPELPKRKDWGRFLLCALTGVMANQLMFFEGLNLTTPIQAAIILTANPILVMVAAAFLAGERITSLRIAGIALGIAGALLLILQRPSQPEGSDELLGNVLIFLNAASYALYLVLVKRLMREYQLMTVMTWVFLPGLLMVLPFGARSFLETPWLDLPPGIMGILVFIVLGTTFLAYLLNAYALSTVSASVVSVYVYLQPFLASLFALMLGKDSLNVRMLISALLVFTGVYLTSYRRKG